MFLNVDRFCESKHVNKFKNALPLGVNKSNLTDHVSHLYDIL